MIDNEALQSIEKLHEMKAAGIISDDEFTQAKQRLLRGNQPRSVAKDILKAPAEPPAETDYVGWMTLPIRRYAKFDGRSSRKEFWLFMLLTNAVALVLSFVFVSDTNFLGYTGTTGNLALALLVLGVLAVLVPFIAVQVRRFHDQGKSGWFALINLIPYLGVLIVLGFMLVPGVEGDNEYGPDPRR